MKIQKMRHTIYLLLVLVSAIGQACAQRNRPFCATDEMLEPFEAHTADGLPYREAWTCDTCQGQAALFVFLHSHSGSGSDNTSQMNSQAVFALLGALRKSGTKACLLVPQCPADREWCARGSKTGLTEEVLKLARRYSERQDIDSLRMFLIGASMGGCGVWEILTRQPALFCAAHAASAAPNGNIAEIATPVCITVGEREKTCRRLADCAAQLKEQGTDVWFEVLANLSHGQACENAITPESVEWLLSHGKKAQGK